MGKKLSSQRFYVKKHLSAVKQIYDKIKDLEKILLGTLILLFKHYNERNKNLQQQTFNKGTKIDRKSIAYG